MPMKDIEWLRDYLDNNDTSAAMADGHWEYEVGPDIDLDTEAVYEPDGTRLTEARAEQLAAETLAGQDLAGNR